MNKENTRMPKIGDVFRDNDIRSGLTREGEVVATGRTRALLKWNTGTRRWVQVMRLNDTSDRGYTLIKEGNGE